MTTTAQDADIPSVLRQAWSTWSATSRLLDSTTFRRKQFGALLDNCRDIMQQSALYFHEDSQTDVLVDVKDAATRIETASKIVKNLLTTVIRKGFLWSVMHAAKLNGEFEDCEKYLEETFTWLRKIALDTRKFKLSCAVDVDQHDLSRMLESFPDGEKLAKALQGQEPRNVHRTVPEILVALRKHTQARAKRNEPPLPEDTFIEQASAVLSHWCQIADSAAVRPFVISSVEVDFDVRDRIGKGSFAYVYKGYWNGILVAVKQIRPDRAHIDSEHQRKEFRHEVITWSNLAHPNVLAFYGACLEAEVPFLLMEYCPFGHITRYLEEHPDADRMRLSQEVAAGLAHLHSQHIVHADVKPDNVLINETHRARLADFGLALQLHRLDERSTFSQYMNQRRGTRLYMAPEVQRGGAPGLEADVWSLGLTIWQMFSGEVPFGNYLQSEHVADAVAQNAENVLKRPDQLVNDEAWAIMQRCWSADSAVRPRAKEVQDGLRAPVVGSGRKDGRISCIRLDPNMFEYNSVSDARVSSVYATADDGASGSTTFVNEDPAFAIDKVAALAKAKAEQGMAMEVANLKMLPNFTGQTLGTSLRCRATDSVVSSRSTSGAGRKSGGKVEIADEVSATPKNWVSKNNGMDGSIVGRAKVSRAGIIGAGPRSDSPVRAAAGVAEARSITSSGFEVPSSSDHCYPAPSALSRCTPEGSSSPIPDVVVVDDWVTSGTKRRKSSSTVSAGSGPNRRTDRLMKTRSDARAKTSSRQDASQMVPGADDGARVTPPASLKTESVVLPASSALPTPASSLAKTRSKRHSHHKSKPVSVEQASFQSRKDARLVAGSVEETKSIRAWTMSTVSLVIPSPATTVPSSGGDPPAQHSVISPSWRTSSYSPSLASEFLMVEASSVGVARRKQTADALSRKSSSKSGLRESASRLLSPIAVPPVPSLKGVSDNLQDRLQDSSSPSGDLESALPWNLDRFLEVTDFRRSFGFKDFHRFSQVFRDTAASMKNSHLLSLSQASGDRARNIVRLAMYQHVMLCDDSQSLAAGDTFSTMQAVVEYIADVVTMAIPDERYDVRVRFVNSPVEMNSRSELKGGFEAVCPAGENNLGVSLRDRVLGPFVYDVLRIRNKLLERPLLVSVIIDSAPQFEQRTVFRDAVAECKARLEEARYAPTTVLFVIFVTGDTTEVKEYVDDLREDAALRDVVYFPADSLRERYYELRPNIGKFGEWVMNMLMAPVLRLEEV